MNCNRECLVLQDCEMKWAIDMYTFNTRGVSWRNESASISSPEPFPLPSKRRLDSRTIWLVLAESREITAVRREGETIN